MSSNMLVSKLAIMAVGEGIRGDMFFPRYIDWVKSVWERLCLVVEKPGVVDSGKLLLSEEGEEGAVIKA